MFRTAFHLTVAALLLIPTFVHAHGSCPHERPHALALDLDGIETISIELGRHTLRLDGAEDADGIVRGRACATSEARLAELTLVQRREGKKLVLRAEDGGRSNVFRWLGKSDYAVHELELRIPARLDVELGVGSGDASVASVAALDVNLGSGDLHVRQVSGAVTLVVGSGDATLESLAQLTVPSVGSGDVTATSVGGVLEIGSVGSGDITVQGIAGSALIGSIGSGDVELYGVVGDVRAGSVGSGDLSLDGVDGGVELDSLGSGDLRVNDIEGDVHLKRKGSGDVHPSNVRGEVSIVIQPRS